MIVCHFTSAHPSNDVRIFEKECVSLAQAGFEVYLVAAGECDRVDKGVHIVSVKPEKQGRLYRMRRFAKLIFRKALEMNADVYHFHDPELMRFAKKLKRAGKVVIYDIHEDLPRSILSKPYLKNWLRNFISHWVERYENRIASITTCNITATPHIESRFKKINTKTYSIYNFPEFNISNPLVPFAEKGNYVCYTGGLSEIRGISEILKAMEISQAQLILAGVAESAAVTAEIEHSVATGNTIFKGKVSRSGVNEILKESKAGLVTFLPEPNHINAQPNKMFEYMAAGIPVIASDFPLWQKIISENKCGVCVDPTNIQAIADAINSFIANNEIAQQMGENGRKAVEEKFNWKVEEKKLIELYQHLSTKIRTKKDHVS